MYYEFFGLREAPFRITPNTDFFFGGGNRGPILEALLYAVTHGEGIVKVSGEVGSGKTMLCNMMMERLPDNVETVYIANPSVSPDEILHAIAFDLQLPTTPQASRLEVMQALHDYLLKRYAEGKRVVVFVEESQGMPLATLEEIRLLSNLETRNDKLLQIVLFGQPELDDNLHQPSIRQLRDRITHSFRLAPLNNNDIREYLMFRMRTAGYRGPDLFPNKVVDLIARASAGLTRRVNLLADKTLLAAFAENTHTLMPKHVEAAIGDSEFSYIEAALERPIPRWRWAWAALGGFIVGAAGYAWYAHRAVAPGASPSAAASSAVSAVATPPAPSAPLNATGSPAAAGAATNGPAVALPPPTPASGGMGADATPSTETSAPSMVARSVEQPNDDVLKERLDATARWLANESDTTWTLQTLSTTSEDDLRNHLRFLKKSIEINDIFVYRHIGDKDQKPVLQVLYGRYDNRGAAEQKMAELPAQLKSNRPLPRTVQSIRDGLR